MENTDVLVVGGSAAGIVAATTGKSFYPDKDFCLSAKKSRWLFPVASRISLDLLRIVIKTPFLMQS